MIRTATASRSATSAAAAARSVVPEQLEGRTLFAASIGLSAAGVLSVTGTAAKDDVYVSYQGSGNKVLVQQREAGKSAYVVTHTFDRAKVKSVVAKMGDGDDRFVLGTLMAGINSTIEGGKGADHLLGGDGKDVIRAGDGNDYMDGGYGDDTLDGGLGRDTFFGNRGNDTADYSARSENLVINSSDYYFNDGAKGEGDYVDDDIETIIGGKGNDTITGSAFNNTLIGGAGNDTLRGGGGDDKLYGGLGVDKLYGEAGNDTLYGRGSPADKDLLDGGAGTDKAQKDASDTVSSVEAYLA